jgi:hypothetical protein
MQAGQVLPAAAGQKKKDMTDKQGTLHSSLRQADTSARLPRAALVPQPALARQTALRAQAAIRAIESRQADAERAATSAGARAAAAQRTPFAYESVLRQLLPQGARELLLTACLAPACAARVAWEQFLGTAPDAEAFFEHDATGIQTLLPLLEASLEHHDIAVGQPLRSYLRKGAHREELRGELYAAVLEETVHALHSAGVPTLLLKSAALSMTLYQRTPLRQGYAIDLLVHPNQMAAAVAALDAAGFIAGPLGAGAAVHRDFRHTSGLAVSLHSRLFLMPQFAISGAQLRQRRQTVRVRERNMLVISPEDNLVHLCAHGLYSPSRHNVRWLCEAYYLLRHTPQLNWRQLVATTISARLAAPMFVLLHWLQTRLDVAVPLGYLAELEKAAAGMDALAAEGICASLVNSLGCWKQTSAALGGNARQVWGLVRFGVLPSTDYLRWKSNTDGTASPLRLRAAHVCQVVKRISGRAEAQQARTPPQQHAGQPPARA